MFFNRGKNVFISYRRSSQANYAHLLETHLKHVGCHVFLDVIGISIGDNFLSAIKREVSRSDCIIILICHQWASIFAHKKQSGDTDYVITEISMAIKQKKQIIPLLLEGAKMPNEEDLPIEIKPIAMLQAKEFNLDTKDALFSLLENEIGCRGKVRYANFIWPLSIFIALFIGVWYLDAHLALLSTAHSDHQLKDQSEVSQDLISIASDQTPEVDKLEELLKVFVDKQSDHDSIIFIEDALSSIVALGDQDSDKLDKKDLLFIELARLYLKVNKKIWPIGLLNAHAEFKRYQDDYYLFQKKWIQVAEMKTSKAMKYIIRKMRMAQHLSPEFNQCFSHLNTPVVVFGTINNRPGALKSIPNYFMGKSVQRKICKLRVSSLFHHDVLYEVTYEDQDFFMPLYVGRPVQIHIQCQGEEDQYKEILPSVGDDIGRPLVKYLSDKFNFKKKEWSEDLGLKHQDVCKNYIEATP